MSAINYARVNWKDYPNTDTPHNAANLNKMDKGIYDLDQQVTQIKSDLTNKEDKHNYVSVTANGIKNISTLLNELFALLDTTKITQLSTIETDRGFGHINGRSSGYVSFVTTYFDSYVGFQYAYLRASDSKLLRFRSSNSWTEEDISSEVPSSGVVFRIYY